MRDPEALRQYAETYDRYSDLCIISDNLLYFLSEEKPTLTPNRVASLEQEAGKSEDIDEFLVEEAIKLFPFIPKKVSSIELRKNLIVLREPNIKRELIWDLKKISEFVEQESGRMVALGIKTIEVSSTFKELVAEEAKDLWPEDEEPVRHPFRL